MKIVVIGGTGLIGSKLVKRLAASGHEAVAASPNSGVNTLTGEGLDAALAGAQVVVDVANSPSFEDRAVLEFFQASGRNLQAAEGRAGVRHHVALSVVGTQRLQESGYFRGKEAQEKLIREGSIPWTIVHCTQFFEFLGGIVQAGAEGDTVRLAPVSIQPISSDDVAAFMHDIALAPPANGIVQIAGPDRLRLTELVGQYLQLRKDAKRVVADPAARYFGAPLEDDTLVPAAGQARLGSARILDWLKAQAAS